MRIRKKFCYSKRKTSFQLVYCSLHTMKSVRSWIAASIRLRVSVIIVNVSAKTSSCRWKIKTKIRRSQSHVFFILEKSYLFLDWIRIRLLFFHFFNFFCLWSFFFSIKFEIFSQSKKTKESFLFTCHQSQYFALLVRVINLTDPKNHKLLNLPFATTNLHF